MAQPFDYTIDVPDPTSSVLNALKIKYAVQQNQREQLAAEQAAQQQKLMQADLATLSQNPTAQGITEMMVKYPTLSENFKRTYDVLNTEQKKAKTDQAWQVYAALSAGDTDMATNLMETQAQAEENSGNAREAKTLRDINQLIKTRPEAGLTTVGMFLANAQGAENFTDNVAKLQEARQSQELQPGNIKKQTAELEKMASDLDLAPAQKNKVLAETKKLDAEARKAALELESLKTGGTIDPQKRFEQEEKLRKEFTSRTQKYNEVNDSFANLKASAEAGNGPGDVALITAFMKMLDPGSVVRETEFATAQNTSGLITQLTNKLKQVNTGELLNPAERKKFSDLAQKYLDAANQARDKQKKDMGTVVKNYGLNADNVFGSPTQATPQGSEPPTTETQQTQTTQETPATRNIVVDY